jgi:MGT family glycosyltransferase
MENKKGKNILFVIGVFEDNIPGAIEIIKDLIDLGHTITCYILEEFSDKIKETGAKIKTIKIDKSDFSKYPPLLLERIALSLTISKSYDSILNDALNSEEKYDFFLVDSFFDGTEMNKIFKIPTVISLYSYPLEEKTPFIELTKQKRMLLFNNINKKYNLNIRDYLSIKYIADAKYKLILTSKLFNNNSKILDDSFYFIGPALEENTFDDSFNFKKDENKKLINISLFSLFHNNIDFYKICIQAFENSKEYQLIIKVGKKVDIKEFGDLPENIFVFNNVPQHQVLPMTDVFITDSRIDSITKGLFLNNLPLIIIRQEIEYNICKLIEKLEVGIVLDIKNVNKESLFESVSSFISNKPKYKSGIEKISESFKESRKDRKKILEKIFS